MRKTAATVSLLWCNCQKSVMKRAKLKKAYLSAMQESPVDSTDIFNLIKNALTEDINNREIFMKGIDYSYYYEQVNE